MSIRYPFGYNWKGGIIAAAIIIAVWLVWQAGGWVWKAVMG